MDSGYERQGDVFENYSIRGNDRDGWRWMVCLGYDSYSGVEPTRERARARVCQYSDGLLP